MATTIKFLKEKKFKNPVLITGLPGIGLVGKISIEYLLKHLKTEKIAEIQSDSFPPSVHTKNAIIEPIVDELHAYEKNGQQFIFLTGPVQPVLDFRIGSSAEHYEFAGKIADTMKDLNVKRIYTLAGINIGNKRMEKKKPEVVAASTSREILNELTKYGVRIDKKEGLISGAAGLIIGMGMQRGIDGVCLMGETNAKLIYGDHGAAKKMIEIITKMFGFNIDMKGIEKEAKHIEEAFTQLARQLEDAEPEEKPPADLTYVR